MNEKEFLELLKKAYKKTEEDLIEFLGENYSKYVMERAYRKRFLRWVLIFLVLIPSLVFIVRELAKFLQGA